MKGSRAGLAMAPPNSSAQIYIRFDAWLVTKHCVMHAEERGCSAVQDEDGTQTGAVSLVGDVLH